MKIERPLYQKLNSIADWIIRVVVTNVLVIVTLLPIVTWYAALSAGFNVFSDYLAKDEENIFKRFLEHFRAQLPKRMLIGAVVILSVLFVSYNMLYYEEILTSNGHPFYTVGYYAMFSLVIIILVLTLQSFAVLRVYPNASFRTTFRLSFFFSGKYFIRTFLLIATWTLPVFLFFTPFLMTVFFLTGVGLPLLLQALIEIPVLQGLRELGDRHD
ncbi:MAG: DUF624 domain-containing protein [Acholeplasmataceae bacterium]